MLAFYSAHEDGIEKSGLGIVGFFAAIWADEHKV
jgi:hypothetical protein